MQLRFKLVASVLVGMMECTLFGTGRAAESCRTIFVSTTSGQDGNDGLSSQTPWLSLAKVNAAELRPGDRVLFKRGGTWRGQLVPRSGREGASITYGAYGQGERPVLLGSISRNDPGDWHREGDHIWATAKLAFRELAPLGNFARAPWWVYAESSAKVKTATILPRTKGELPVLKVECVSSGTAANHIQISNSGLQLKEGDYYEFAFRVRGSKPFAITNVSLMRESAPWTNYGHGTLPKIEVGPDWTDGVVLCQATRSADDGRITIFLGGMLPEGSLFSLQPVSWKRLQCTSSEELSLDVGNIIFDRGKSVGVKKWKPVDLKKQDDYWYCGETWQVKLVSERNPAEVHESLELALRRHIVDQSNQSHVVYEGLALCNGAAHGFGGGNTHDVVIRNCDVAWIGGGRQLTGPDGKPVRFGNGIEFWENAHDNLVEGCRIWEIYDAALTNQGSQSNSQINITYRDNVIWNSEYSFEYWNRGPESTTRNIRFEHNTCVNAGLGWGHAQRPDPNGRHLMFYANTARTSEFSVRENIFCNATDSCLRIDNDWTAGLSLDRNCWSQTTGVLMQFLRTPFAAPQFTEYQKLARLDTHSIVADPKFVNCAALDFRLTEDSPPRKLGASGGPVGAVKRLEK
jgi:hypothetical protein